MRITVISPFIDKKHGTERCVAELIEKLAYDHGCEIHLYAQRVEDLALEPRPSPGPGAAGFVCWHRVMSIRGPHLVQFVWWFGANTLLRRWDVRCRRVCSELLFSPGINAWDADVTQVHMVFEEFYQRMKSQLQFRASAFLRWPLLIHRRLYYGLIRRLERQIYARKQVHLAAVSDLVRTQLGAHYRRPDAHCVRNGVDISSNSLLNFACNLIWE